VPEPRVEKVGEVTQGGGYFLEIRSTNPAGSAIVNVLGPE